MTTAVEGTARELGKRIMHTQQSRLPLTTYSQAVRAPLTFVEKYSRSKTRTWKLVDISPEEQRDGHGDHHHRQHRGQLGREALRQVLGQNAFFLRTHRRRAKTISDVKQPRDMSSPAPSRKTRAWPQHLPPPPARSASVRPFDSGAQQQYFAYRCCTHVQDVFDTAWS